MVDEFEDLAKSVGQFLIPEPKVCPVCHQYIPRDATTCPTCEQLKGQETRKLEGGIQQICPICYQFMRRGHCENPSCAAYIKERIP